ncbi:MAG: hypothetical protein H6738_11930 [Alphaproteobacteria bacterium]|nr:hypothetical protein [Alphaproteobacteria bacterium]MCB9697481.1 hypothetical protein [Alphaproteobacteria bacterium]
MIAWLLLACGAAPTEPVPWMEADGPGTPLTVTPAGRRAAVGERGLLRLEPGLELTAVVSRRREGADSVSWFADVEGDPLGRVGLTFGAQGMAGTLNARGRRFELVNRDGRVLLEERAIEPARCDTP